MAVRKKRAKTIERSGASPAPAAQGVRKAAGIKKNGLLSGLFNVAAKTKLPAVFVAGAVTAVALFGSTSSVLSEHSDVFDTLGTLAETVAQETLTKDVGPDSGAAARDLIASINAATTTKHCESLACKKHQVHRRLASYAAVAVPYRLYKLFNTEGGLVQVKIGTPAGEPRFSFHSSLPNGGPQLALTPAGR